MLETDRKIIKADGEDLSFITAKVLDKEGNFVPDANLKIDFLVSGKGTLIATDNGDPADLVSFGSKQRKSYNGLALGIIKSQKNKPGKIKIKISAENLESAEIEIISK
jgi:beta-galactosidase